MSIESGSYTALLTPYSDGGDKINFTSIAAMIDRNIDHRISGLYVGGSTAETFLQSYDERVSVLQETAKLVQGRTRLIAQVGDMNPRTSHKLARIAADAGYDAISAIPPFYFKYDSAELLDYYRTLSSVTNVPFVIYNIPALTGVIMGAGQITELLNLPNVIALKNTTLDYYAMEQIIRENPDKLIFNGYDETALSGLAVGACGVIGSTLNVQGNKFVDLYKAYHANDAKKSSELQSEINQLIDAIVPLGVFRSLKYLLDLEGIPMGDCRAPFRPLSDDGKYQLAKAHEKYLSR